MGNRGGKFEEETMKDFEATTPFNRAEIYHAYKVFRRLSAEYESRPNEDSILPQHLTPNGYIDPEDSLPVSFIADNLPQLRVNPFRHRICGIFVTSDSDKMSFVEFLDMVSAFSPKNSLQQKTFHAFHVFDIDQDGIISRKDIMDMLDMITDEGMTEGLKKRIIDEVFQEVNKEASSDGLNTEDFHFAISRAPDFQATFGFRI